LLRGIRALRLGYSRSGVCDQPLPSKLHTFSQEKQQRLESADGGQIGLPPVAVPKNVLVPGFLGDSSSRGTQNDKVKFPDEY
jgi:hypothetical protein